MEINFDSLLIMIYRFNAPNGRKYLLAAYRSMNDAACTVIRITNNQTQKETIPTKLKK